MVHSQELNPADDTCLAVATCRTHLLPEGCICGRCFFNAPHTAFYLCWLYVLWCVVANRVELFLVYQEFTFFHYLSMGFSAIFEYPPPPACSPPAGKYPAVIFYCSPWPMFEFVKLSSGAQEGMRMRNSVLQTLRMLTLRWRGKISPPTLTAFCERYVCTGARSLYGCTLDHLCLSRMMVRRVHGGRLTLGFMYCPTHSGPSGVYLVNFVENSLNIKCLFSSENVYNVGERRNEPRVKDAYCGKRRVLLRLRANPKYYVCVLTLSYTQCIGFVWHG